MILLFENPGAPSPRWYFTDVNLVSSHRDRAKDFDKCQADLMLSKKEPSGWLRRVLKEGES